MTLYNLPIELLHKIHCLLLDDLDITTVPKPYEPLNYGAFTNRRPNFWILDPTTLSRIKFYEKLFEPASAWGAPTWEYHVRFVFPCVLSMADVFVTYHLSGRLKYIRNIKVFERRAMHFGPRFGCSEHPEPGVWDFAVCTILDAFSRPLALKLDHLEYEGVTSFQYELPSLLANPTWKRFTLLGCPVFLDNQVTDWVSELFKNVAGSDLTTKYTLKFPLTPTIRDKEISIANNVRMTDDERDIANEDYFFPSWIDGSPTAPQVVVKRDRFPVARPYEHEYFELLDKRFHEWMEDGSLQWKTRRRCGCIAYVCD